MEQPGPFFEDLEVNQRFRHWPGRTITEADDTFFSMLTMNTNPIHFDAHYAAQSQHGQRLVNGTFVFSLVVGMSVRDTSMSAIANLDYQDVRHLAPVFHGDTIYAESVVLDKRESQSRTDRGIVHIETVGKNQHGEPVISYRRHVMLPRRPA